MDTYSTKLTNHYILKLNSSTTHYLLTLAPEFVVERGTAPTTLGTPPVGRVTAPAGRGTAPVG